jgi:glycosyltransferase involved in cell wall biosynthesis
MKVLHLASGNRWTGAAAPAFAETEALRQAGVDAHYAYVGGYKLQQKIGHHDFTHAIIGKAQNPWSFLRTADAISRLISHHRFDVVHAHLTYDHWLTLFGARGSGPVIVRTFHAARVVRNDPFTRWLIDRTDGIFVNNDSFAAMEPVRRRNPIFTPPPLDERQFKPDGPDLRSHYGLGPETLLLMAIGKLSRGRGFEDVLRTYAVVRREIANARLMIIGHGEHRPALEALARELAVDVIWAGHYRAADILLFTARGSDEGHRAVIEAMACGVVPVTFPIAGIPALLGALSDALIASAATPEAAAKNVAAVARGDIADLRRRAYEQSQEFSYARAAERLIGAYERFTASSRRRVPGSRLPL